MERSSLGIDRGNDPLEPEKIKDFQEIIERVGSRKTQGFIHIFELQGDVKVDETDGMNTQAVEGCLFSNAVNNETIVINMLDVMFPSAYKKAEFIQKIQSEFRKQ